MIAEENIKILSEGATEIESLESSLCSIPLTLEQSQLKNNPFRNKIRSVSDVGAENSIDNDKLPKSNSVLEQQGKTRLPINQCARVIFEQISKPSAHSIELPLLDEFLDTSLDQTHKHIDLNDKTKEEYKIEITTDVKLNFSKLQNFIPITQEDIERKMIMLPELKQGKKSNKTLFLDIDETLLHTIEKKRDYSMVDIDMDLIKTTTYINSYMCNIANIQVIMRPYLKQFLKEISKYYELVVIQFFN